VTNVLEGMMNDIKSILKRVSNLEASKTLKANDTIIYFGAADDVNLYRAGADTLATDDIFAVAKALYIGGNGVTAQISFGTSWGTYDTNLYRASGNTLKTDDSFVVALNQQINGNLYFYTSGAYIYFGDSAGGYDVNLYRASANVLMTDNAMVIAQGSASYAKTVLSLSQADIDDTFIDFKGTSAADKTRSISTSTVGNFTYTGMVRVDVNGTQYWMPYYA